MTHRYWPNGGPTSLTAPLGLVYMSDTSKRYFDKGKMPCQMIRFL